MMIIVRVNCFECPSNSGMSNTRRSFTHLYFLLSPGRGDGKNRGKFMGFCNQSVCLLLRQYKKKLDASRPELSNALPGLEPNAEEAPYLKEAIMNALKI